MTPLTRTWLAFAAFGAGLIHLAIAAGSALPLAITLAGLGVAELGWGVAILHLGTVIAPRTVVVISLVPLPKWGVSATHRLYTAKPPSILDVPLVMHHGSVEIPDPQTPIGSKGIGEAPFGAGCAAVLCAIQDAIGELDLKRSPMMTDLILNQLEHMPQPYKVLATHV